MTLKLSRTQKISSGFNFQTLDLLRGLAAFAVLTFHYRHFYLLKNDSWVEKYEVAIQPGYKTLSILYTHGAQAVQLFWVISGFVLSHSYLTKNRSKKDFYLSRFSRLYPLHFLTLIVVTILQLISLAILNHSQIYGNNDLKHFLLNVFFIPDIGFEDGYSFNGPIWSVSVELLAYLVFGLVSGLAIRYKFIPVCIIGISIVIAISNSSTFLNFDMNSAVLYFFCGVVSYQLLNKFKDVIILILGITLLLVYFLLKSFEIHQLDSTDLFWRIARHDYFIVILFVSILLIISSLEFIYKSHLTSLSKFSTWIGDLTYSTYLLHVPIQILLLTIIQYLELDQLKIANEIWFFLLYLFFIVALGRLSYSKFEKPARKYLRGKL